MGWLWKNNDIYYVLNGFVIVRKLVSSGREI